MQKTQLLSQPDHNILQFLTDARVWSTAAGAAGEAVLEKYLFTHARAQFGVAALEGGVMKFYVADADGKATGVQNAQLGTNRQLARAGVVLASVAAIEYCGVGEVQYAALGVAAVAVAHILQDFFPTLK